MLFKAAINVYNRLMLGCLLLLPLLLQTPPQPPAAAGTPADAQPAITQSTLNSLVDRIIEGDAFAFEELQATADELYLNIDYQKEAKRVHDNFILMGNAYGQLAIAAKRGDEDAILAIYDSLKYPHLKSFAPLALGLMAGDGDQKALEFLLDYKKNGILASSAAAALIAAAYAQNPKAIAFFIDVRHDKSQSGLWLIANEGLLVAERGGSTLAAEARKAAPPFPTASSQPTTQP